LGNRDVFMMKYKNEMNVFYNVKLSNKYSSADVQKAIKRDMKSGQYSLGIEVGSGIHYPVTPHKQLAFAENQQS
jgi:hypothetical protein